MGPAEITDQEQWDKVEEGYYHQYAPKFITNKHPDIKYIQEHVQHLTSSAKRTHNYLLKKIREQKKQSLQDQYTERNETAVALYHRYLSLIKGVKFNRQGVIVDDEPLQRQDGSQIDTSFI